MNLSTAIILVAIAALVFFSIRHALKLQKAGKCMDCPSAGKGGEACGACSQVERIEKRLEKLDAETR